MNAEINEIIAKHMPAQVGEVLKLRLIAADADAAALAKANETIQKQGRTILDLQGQVTDIGAIKSRIDALNKGEAELTKRLIECSRTEAVLLARSEMGKQMIEANKEIVLAVFANNKMKYTENRADGVAFPGVPMPGCGTPYPQITSVQSMKSVEVTGG